MPDRQSFAVPKERQELQQAARAIRRPRTDGLLVGLVRQAVGEDRATLTVALTIPGWTLSFGDLFVIAGSGLLVVDVIFRNHHDANLIINHGLYMLLAAMCVIMLITMEGFASLTFIVLTLLAISHVAFGFAITMISRE